MVSSDRHALDSNVSSFGLLRPCFFRRCQDEDADGDDSEAFETPQKAKKRPKVSQPSAQKGSGASAKRKGTAAPTAPPSTANETPNKEAVKSPTNTSKKGTSASKGKGRAGASKSTKAMPSQDGSARSTPDSTLSALKGTKVDKPSPAALDMGDTASLSGSAAAPASSNSVPIMSNGARAGGADASADSIPAVKSAAKTPKASEVQAWNNHGQSEEAFHMRSMEENNFRI